jgi:hypothetical protein
MLPPSVHKRSTISKKKQVESFPPSEEEMLVGQAVAAAPQQNLRNDDPHSEMRKDRDDFANAEHFKMLMSRAENAKALIIYQSDGKSGTEAKLALDMLCSDEWGIAPLPLFSSIPQGRGGRAIYQICQKQLPLVQAGLEPYRNLILKHIEAGTCLSIGVWPKRVIVPLLPTFENVPEVGSPSLWRTEAHLEETHSILSKILSEGEEDGGGGGGEAKKFMDIESFNQILTDIAKQAGTLDKKTGDSERQSGTAGLSELQRRLEGGDDLALLAYDLGIFEINLRARLRRVGGQMSSLMSTAKRVDRSDSAQLELLKGWSALGFSPSDMAIMHPTPLSNVDVAKVLNIHDFMQKPEGKVAATISPGGLEWLSTEELRTVMNESGGPDRLSLVLMAARGSAKIHAEWLSFLQRVHRGEAEASDCPTGAPRKNLRGSKLVVTASPKPTMVVQVSNEQQPPPPPPHMKTRRGPKSMKSTVVIADVTSSPPPPPTKSKKVRKGVTTNESLRSSEIQPKKRSRRNNRDVNETPLTKESGGDEEQELLNDLDDDVMVMSYPGGGGGAASSSSL